jgi:hypothetical protein
MLPRKKKENVEEKGEIIRSIEIDMDGDCTMAVWRKSSMNDI